MNSSLYRSRLRVPGVRFTECFRRLITDTSDTSESLPTRIGSSRYEAGDRVLITYKNVKRIKQDLLPPLRHGGVTCVGNEQFEVKHEDIIGKQPRRLYVNAVSKKQRHTLIRVAQPSLDEFVSLTPRSVTPIYASYSAFMTDRLDINVCAPRSDNDPVTSDAERLEILEAGTGHGSLTLHLARAIAAANPPPPTDTSDTAMEQWRSSRRAILHTVEFVKPRSKETEQLIKSFRSALYWPHIDFYSGDATAWVRSEQERRAASTLDNPNDYEFLDIVCLDMPNVQQQIEHMVKAMKNDGKLLIYVPQITQLAACQQEIDRLALPLKLDQILELGEGISNGREWDLRFVKPRAEIRLEQQQEREKERERERAQEQSHPSSPEGEILPVVPPDTSPKGVGMQSNIAQSMVNIAEPVSTAASYDFPTMVCRPLVGKMIMGGAFIGLWRKAVLPPRDVNRSINPPIDAKSETVENSEEGIQ